MSTSIGSLVGGVLATRDDATEELSARASGKRESGVLGSCGEDDEDATFAAEFSAALDFSAFGARGLKAAAGLTVGFEKNEVKLFCFKDSVDGLVFGGMVTAVMGKAKVKLG